jgi:hypothetical protein
MYKLNVTSYWYRLRCSQRKVDANIDIVMVVVFVTAVFLLGIYGQLPCQFELSVEEDRQRSTQVVFKGMNERF